MSKLFNSKAKLVFTVYVILFALVIVLSLYYMTNYSDIHVIFGKNTKGELVMNPMTEITIGDMKYTNQYLAMFVNGGHATEFGYTSFSGDFAKFIYDYQMELNEYNQLILIYGLFGLGSYAIYIIFSNHNRSVYYISNLVVGVLVPIGILAFTIVMIVGNLGLMNTFTENEKLFKTVSLLQGDQIIDQYKYLIGLGMAPASNYFKEVSNVNSITFVVATILYVIIAVYSLFIMIYTVLRYKGSTKRRNEIIERAARKND